MKSKSNGPIRVLHYIGSLELGGSQSMVMNLYRHIDRTKIQFDFIVDKKNSFYYKDEIESLGGQVFIFDHPFKGYNFLQFKKQWKDFFKNHPEYKIIHSHVRSVASIVLKIAKKYGMITICHSHSTSNGQGLKSIVKYLLQKRIPKYADYLLACSKESAIWLYGKKNVDNDRCIIINNAIDASKFSFDLQSRKKIRKQFDIENKTVLVQVGRIETVKNYAFTIEVLKDLIKIDNNYYLIIIGDGSLINEIIEKVNSYKLNNNVMFLKNRSDINDILQAADIFVMPSIWEGLSLSLVEAQAASLPCVISSNINSGIMVEDYVIKKDINNPLEWANEIESIKSKSIIRKNMISIIKKRGFDIKDEANRISNFYFGLTKGEK